IYVLNPALLSLDRINKPNLAGAACNYQSTAISFGNASLSSLGCTLPQEVVYAPRPDTLRSRILDTAVCSWKASLKLRPADQTLEDNYVWDNGSTDSTRMITIAGTYWVRYGNSCHYRVDSLVVSGSDLDPVIVVNGLQLGTTLPYSTYQWLFNGNVIPGAVNSTYTLSDTGTYSVVVSDGTCTDTASAHHVANITAVADLKYLAEQISIYPNPAKDLVSVDAPVHVDMQLTGIEGRVIRSVKNSRQLDLHELAAGAYLLRISDKQGRILKVEKLILQK
ncbi:MAG: T9SS type A sorting domain-containing protein, partial [Sphingobacteriales bacterium]